MAKLLKILKHSVLCAAVAVMAIIPNTAGAALGELAISNSIAQEPYFYTDFSDWDGSIIGNVTYDPTKTNWVASSQFGDGFSQYLVKRTDSGEYATASTFWFKLKNFYADAQPGKYTVSFKVKAWNPTATPLKGKLSAKVLDVQESIEAQKWVWKYSNFNIATTNQSEWMDVTLEYDFDGTVSAAVDGIDTNSLCMYFAPAEADSGTWQNYCFDDFKITCPGKETISAYAGKSINLTTCVYNNTSSDKTAELITVLYDDSNNINYTNSQSVTALANTTQDYTWQIPVSAAADDTWRLCTYLWSDDGTIEAYCDEITEFAQLNVNPGMEILNADTATGLLNWEAVNTNSTAGTSGDAYAGKYSLAIPGDTSDGVKMSLNDILAKYGTGNYKLTAMVKSASTGNVTLAYGTNVKAVELTNDWKECTLEFFVKSGTTSGTVILTNTGSTDIYIDDAVLTKIY